MNYLQRIERLIITLLTIYFTLSYASAWNERAAMVWGMERMERAEDVRKTQHTIPLLEGPTYHVAQPGGELEEN